MPTNRCALIDDATGATLATGACPSDLFDADECGEDDEIVEAIARAASGEDRVPVGGGAAPLLWIMNWSE